MATCIASRHPVTMCITVLTNPDNLTNDLLILKLFENKQQSRHQSCNSEILQGLAHQILLEILLGT